MGLTVDNCVSCSDLQEEVKRIAMELKSAWEIIQILQEEMKCDNRGATPRPNLETSGDFSVFAQLAAHAY